MMRGATAATAAVALALAAGCGGSDSQQEDEASYRVAIPHASFPARQHLAQHAEMEIAVRNTGDRTIPNVTATIDTADDGTSIDAFAGRTDASGQASRSRPIWIVDDGPLSGDTAYANTWALGSIGPGRTRTFRWRVVPVRAGSYELRYTLSGSGTGRSQLRLANGTAPNGTFAVQVSGKPAQSRITADGRIVSSYE